MSPGARRFRSVYLLGAVLVACAPLVVRGDVASGIEANLIDLSARYSAAVVRVTVATEELDAAGKPAVFVSTGFFVSREGRVVTTIDPKARVTRIWVEKNGIESLAQLIGADPRTRIGLLQVVKLPERFEVIALEVENAVRPVGSMVLRLSNPLGLETSPSLGLVAGYESFFAENQFPFTYLRVNTPIGLGEEGSPVLDMQGRLAGITVASVREALSSYLVPSRALARLVDDLATHGRVLYGSIPVQFDEFPDARNVARQVVVTRVAPDSSAARAGIRAGDIVRLIGSSPVRRIHDVRDALFFARVGQFIQVEVERGGQVTQYALPVEAVSENGPVGP